MRKKLFYRNALAFSLLVINLALFVADFVGVDKSVITVMLSFTLSASLLGLYLLTEKNVVKLPVNVIYLMFFLLFSICIPLLISITVNGIIEYSATILRTISYFIFMYLTYALSKHGYIKFKDIYNVFILLVLICAVVGGVQILTGNLINMNGANRLSSIYGGTPAGFALLMLLSSSFFYGCLFSKTLNLNKYKVMFFFVASTSMMLLTHSRQALFTLFLLVFFLYWLRSSRYKKVFVIFILLSISSAFYWIVINTELLPRIAILFEVGLSDGSSQTRFSIINSSLNGLSGVQKIIGIGLGGFNHFYDDITGKLGVAAHNDYLLFYVEGGWLSFISFIFITFYGLFYFLKQTKYNDIFYVPLAVFLSISFLSFLNNPLYYAQTQVLAFSIYGFFTSKRTINCSVA